MAYRIEYDFRNQKYEITTTHPPRLPAMIAGAFVLFLLLTYLFWPEGTAVLRDVLIPGDDDVTMYALECLAEDIRGGASVSEAFTCFCREIIHGASSSH